MTPEHPQGRNLAAADLAAAVDVDAFFRHRWPDRQELRAAGKDRRAQVPLASHAAMPLMTSRPDPLAILHEQDSTRGPSLVPLR
jgi:hypothetical protein